MMRIWLLSSILFNPSDSSPALQKGGHPTLFDQGSDVARFAWEEKDDGHNSMRHGGGLEENASDHVSNCNHTADGADDTYDVNDIWPQFLDEVDVELFRRRSVNNTAIILVCNIHYYWMLRRWWEAFEGLAMPGITFWSNITVICSDQGLYDTLRGYGMKGIQLMRAKTPQTTNMSLYPKLKSLSFTRHVVAARLNREGLNVLYTDLDAVWLQNPLPDIFGQAQNDGRPGMVASRGMFPLEISGKWGATICTGILFYYGSLGDAFWNGLNRARNTINTGHDQQYMNVFLHEAGVEWDSPNRLRFKDAVEPDHGVAAAFDMHVTLLPHPSFPRACERLRRQDIRILHCMSLAHDVNWKILYWKDYLELPYTEQPEAKLVQRTLGEQGLQGVTRGTSYQGE